MKRMVLAAGIFLAMVAVSQAHFVYVVPTAGNSVQVVFSDDLQPDKSVPISKVAGTRLMLRSDGKDTPLKAEQVENYLKVEVPGSGTRVIFGRTTYGVVQKGKGKPFLLHYHPKTILGDAFAPQVRLGKSVPVEVVPVRSTEGVKFLVLAGDKPLADAEVFLRKPGADSNETIKTDATGHTPAYKETGRYAVVARKLDEVAGEYNGKKYEEERHYATLIVDVANSR
jgi:uncharacterized GH25 family protein